MRIKTTSESDIGYELYMNHKIFELRCELACGILTSMFPFYMWIPLLTNFKPLYVWSAPTKTPIPQQRSKILFRIFAPDASIIRILTSNAVHSTGNIWYRISSSILRPASLGGISDRYERLVRKGSRLRLLMSDVQEGLPTPSRKIPLGSHAKDQKRSHGLLLQRLILHF